MFLLDTSTIFAVVNCVASSTTVKPIRVENKTMKLNRENTLVALPRYMYNIHRAFIFIVRALIQNVCLSACDSITLITIYRQQLLRNNQSEI